MTELSGKTAKRLLELKEKYGSEEVFVVPYSSTEQIPDLFHRIREKELNTLLDTLYGKGKFILRADAEENMAFQQIIPYAVLQGRDGRWFVSRRIAGEERLRGSLSLGIGGHINRIDRPEPGTPVSVFTRGLLREMNEETNIDDCGIVTLTPYGTVRDLRSSTPDHIGIVYKVFVRDSGALAIREKDALEGIWMTTRELIQNFGKFESWAQLIIAHMTIGTQEAA